MGISVTISGESAIRKRLDAMRRQLGGEETVVNAGLWDEGQETKSGTPVPEYAYYNNYGTPKIPARAFMKFAWEEEKPELVAYARYALAAKGTLQDCLMVIGQNLAAQIRRQILANLQPDNADATKRHKAPGLPTLIDTKTMLNSVTFKISGGEQ